MNVQIRHRFVLVHLAWAFAGLVVLTALDVFTPQFFFIMAFVGFLIFIEYTAPIYLAPPWRARLWWVIVPGFVGFSYIIVQQALNVIGGG